MNRTGAREQGGKGPLGIIGLGAAACVACCIGPITAFLASVGVLGVVSSPWFGVPALAVAVAAIALVVVRRRRRNACRIGAGPVPVDLRDRVSAP